MSTASISEPAPQGGSFRQGLMLTIATAFLALLGLVLPHGDSGTAFREWFIGQPFFLPLIVALCAIVIIEGIVGLAATQDAWPDRLRRFLFTLFLPPLRMITASSKPEGWLWLPGLGWQPTGEKTSEHLDQKLALPMVILTLLVLPVLGAELTGGETLDDHPRMALVTHLTTCVIWIGFTMEFFWMVAASPDKPAYCLKNWVNLAIVLLPLLAFLRVLNLFRFTRMLRAGKLLRAYRLRGLWARLWRLAMLFNILERLQQRHPAKYCVVLEKRIADLEEELAKLNIKLAEQRGKMESASVEAIRIQQASQG